MLVNREVLLIKTESTYGTDATPSNTADALRVEDLAWSHVDSRMVERPSVQVGFNTLKKIYGGTLMQVTFTAEIKGKGAAYSTSSLPEIDAALGACSTARTIVTTSGLETVTYTPLSTPSAQESVTIWYYQDGMLYKLTGCVGDASFNFAAGEYGKVTFTFTGHTSTPSDATIVTPTLDAVSPPIVLSSSFTIASYAAVVNAMEFGFNNVLAKRPSINATDGYGTISVVDREVMGSLDPEAVVVATHDWDAKWRAGTAMALNLGDIGSTQYNKYKLSMPAVYYTEVSPGDRDSIRTFESNFGCLISSGDDEWSLLFD